jgi:hypothetical protein
MIKIELMLHKINASLGYIKKNIQYTREYIFD